MSEESDNRRVRIVVGTGIAIPFVAVAAFFIINAVREAKMPTWIHIFVGDQPTWFDPDVYYYPFCPLEKVDGAWYIAEHYRASPPAGKSYNDRFVNLESPIPGEETWGNFFDEDNTYGLIVFSDRAGKEKRFVEIEYQGTDIRIPPFEELEPVSDEFLNSLEQNPE